MKLTKTRKNFSKPKGGLPFGFGINYLLLNFPLVVFCKYGYTSVGVGVGKRTRQINRAMPGFAIPVFFVPTFFAYEIEQMTHELLRPFRARFYTGDGHTETYWIWAALPALGIMLAIWLANIWALSYIWGKLMEIE